MKIYSKIKPFLPLIVISFFYLISHFYFLDADYNIFDPQEIYSNKTENNLIDFSLFPYLVRYLSALIKSEKFLLAARLISIICGLLAGLTIYFYAHFKRLKNNDLILLLFWLNPYIFYYSKIGQNLTLSLFLLIFSYLSFTIYRKKISIIFFVFAILINPILIIFGLSFYLLYKDQQTTILEEIIYFLLPCLFLLFFSQSNLIVFISPFLAISLVYFLARYSIYIPIIALISFLPLTFKAWQSTLHRELGEVSSYIKNLQNIYYQYPLYSTFGPEEMSIYFGQKVNWLDGNLDNGGLLITDNILSTQLTSPKKIKAFDIYKTRIPKEIEKKSFSTSLSYFPFNYDKNTYHIYLILSKEDVEKIYQNLE